MISSQSCTLQQSSENCRDQFVGISLFYSTALGDIEIALFYRNASFILQIRNLSKHQRTVLEQSNFCMLILDSWVNKKCQHKMSAHSAELSSAMATIACLFVLLHSTAVQHQAVLTYTACAVPSSQGLGFRAYLRSYSLPWVRCMQIPRRPCMHLDHYADTTCCDADCLLHYV